MTAGAPDQTAVGNEAFAAKLNIGGTALDYATYIGGRGADDGLGIGLDGDGNAYVVGNTTSVEEFPFTVGAYDTNNEGENMFVTKVDETGTSFGYSTLLGTGSVINPAIAVDGADSPT